MSISQALGYLEKQIFKQIPEERIKHIGKNYNEPTETSSAKVYIFAENEDDRKILERVHHI